MSRIDEIRSKLERREYDWYSSPDIETLLEEIDRYRAEERAREIQLARIEQRLDRILETVAEITGKPIVGIDFA